MMPSRKEEGHDKAVEDSFPASDPPASSGIVGPRVTPHEPESAKAPRERTSESRPKGTPTDDRHAAETAYQGEKERKPGRKG
jgi:hypothetical protein